MKPVTILLFFLVLFTSSFKAYSQQDKYKKIDAYARTVKTYKNLKDLQVKLTKPYKTDEEKVRSIFAWVADNIAYDVVEYHTDTNGMYDQCQNLLTAIGKYTDHNYDELVVKTIIKNKKAICDGYSRVMKTLCDSAGIECIIVTGVAKNDISMVGKDNASNHAWNVVKIDDKWRIIDATWCAGTCDSAVKVFTKEFSDEYFFPDPVKFSYNHFPDTKKWSLIAANPVKATFDGYPLIHHPFFHEEILSISPFTGVLKVKKGEKIQVSVSLKTGDRKVSLMENNLHVFDDRFKLKRNEVRLSYEYTIESDDVKEVTVYFENKAILTYKVVY
jgi:transglutaminase/protease-like cytokinesis protein 3